MLKPPQDNHAQKQLMQALEDLRGNPAWERVREWLEDQYRQVSDSNDKMHQDVPLRQGQGAAQALRSLLDMQDGARARLEKLRK